jgi:hypothetical protein
MEVPTFPKHWEKTPDGGRVGVDTHRRGDGIGESIRATGIYLAEYGGPTPRACWLGFCNVGRESKETAWRGPRSKVSLFWFWRWP